MRFLCFVHKETRTRHAKGIINVSTLSLSSSLFFPFPFPSSFLSLVFIVSPFASATYVYSAKAKQRRGKTFSSPHTTWCVSETKKTRATTRTGCSPRCPRTSSRIAFSLDSMPSRCSDLPCRRRRTSRESSAIIKMAQQTPTTASSPKRRRRRRRLRR